MPTLQAFMIIVLTANVVTNMINGDRIDYWLGPAIIAGVLVFLLYIEYCATILYILFSMILPPYDFVIRSVFLKIFAI